MHEHKVEDISTVSGAHTEHGQDSAETKPTEETREVNAVEHREPAKVQEIL